MNNYQKELIRIFTVLNQEFKKINLKWYPYAGTLLGVVRHAGLIPWDDDIDMMAKHFDLVEKIEKIKNICKKNDFEIISYTDFFDKDTIRIYSNKISKVKIDNVEFKSKAFIEIHPLKSSFGQEKYNLISFFSNLSSVSNMPIGKYKNSFPLRKTFNFWKRVGKISGIILVPRKLFKKWIWKRLNKKDEGKFYIPIYNFTKTNNFLFDLSKTINLKFENNNVSLPINYLEYLAFKYGKDWNKIPDKISYFPIHIINWNDNRLKWKK